MAIKHLIVHQATKAGEPKKLQVKTRKEENSIEGLSEEVVDKLVKLFNETGLSSGSFAHDQNPEELQPRFAEILSASFKNNIYDDFILLTDKLTKLFAYSHLEKTSNASGGYLVFYHSVRGDTHFLSVVLLNMTTGMTLTDALDFNESQRLDLEHLHLAARINLTQWFKGKEKRYLAFKLGRKANEMRDYFSDFIGCKEFIADKADTRTLVKVISDYATQLDYSFEQTTRAGELAKEYCIRCKTDGEKVNLEHLAKHVFPKKPEGMLTIAQNDPHNLNNEIGIDKRELRTFTRYSGNNKNLSLSFSRELLNDTIIYDGKKSITINELPDNLIAQLKLG